MLTCARHQMARHQMNKGKRTQLVVCYVKTSAGCILIKTHCGEKPYVFDLYLLNKMPHLALILFLIHVCLIATMITMGNDHLNIGFFSGVCFN